MARGLLRAAGVIGLCGLRLGLLVTLLLGLTAARGNPVAMALAAGAAPAYVLLERRRPGGAVWLFYVAAFLLFVYLRQLADDFGPAARAEYAIAADSALPGSDLPTVWLQQLAFDPARIAIWDVAATAVHASYFATPHIAAFALWRRGSALFRRYCFALLASLYAGLLTCAVLPTVPPWLAAQEGQLSPVHHVIAAVWNRAGDGAYDQGEAAVGPNPVAAMPSLHMVGAVLVGLVLWRVARGRFAPTIRVAAIVYPAAMALALVYTGEHYVVDVAAGAAVAIIAWFAAPAAIRVIRPGWRLPAAAALERP